MPRQGELYRRADTEVPLLVAVASGAIFNSAGTRDDSAALRLVSCATSAPLRISRPSITILDTAWWLATGWHAGEAAGRNLEQRFWVIGGSLDAVVFLGMGIILIGIGGLFHYDAHQLRRLRLLIDHRGIAPDNQQHGVPLDRIRHIAVTSGKPGWRRLLVDDGRNARPLVVAHHPIHPGRAQLRLLTRRRRFVVNLPDRPARCGGGRGRRCDPPPFRRALPPTGYPERSGEQLAELERALG